MNILAKKENKIDWYLEKDLADKMKEEASKSH
jgi:hypothetical protein